MFINLLKFTLFFLLFGKYEQNITVVLTLISWDSQLVADNSHCSFNGTRKGFKKCWTSLNAFTVVLSHPPVFLPSFHLLLLQQDHTCFIIHLFIKSNSETNHIGKKQLNNGANHNLLGVLCPKNLVYPYVYSYSQKTLSISGKGKVPKDA